MTGIELITKERQEQIEKHGRTPQYDIEVNNDEQLTEAAFVLMAEIPDDIKPELCPEGWDEAIWIKMVNKPYKDRLITAAALIAAEIDRLQHKTTDKE